MTAALPAMAALSATIAPLLRLDQPWWLLAAAAAALPLVLAARAARRGRRTPLWAVALQCAAVLAAAAALVQPAWRTSQKGRLPWLLLRDVSPSTRGQDSNCTNWPAELPRDSMDFGRAEDGAAERTLLRPVLQTAVGRSGELAGAAVVSDGQWHDARWEDAAEALRRAGLPLLVVPLSNPPSDGRIAMLHADRRGDGNIVVAVVAAADAPMKRTLTIRREAPGRDPRRLLEKEVQLLPGESYETRLVDREAPLAVSSVYRAELSGGDAFPENDSATAVVPPDAVVAALVTDAAAPLLPPGRMFEVIHGAAAPSTAAAWSRFRFVMLDDPDGNALSAAQRASLAQYVRDGGGLVIAGAGPFAASADRDDPLNRVAALVPNPYERRPLRVVVALDCSGSMGEAEGPTGSRRKYDLAVEAVASLRSHLTPKDSLAVVTFSDTARRVYDSSAAASPAGGQAGPDFAALREAMAKVQPGGPTVVAPALEEATAVAPPSGSEGLVIVVSDLAAKSFDEAKMAERFRSQRYRLAVVNIGPAPAAPAAEGPSPSPSPVDETHSRSLYCLVRLLDGPLVSKEDLRGLAEVFGQFIHQARGEVIRHGSFRLAAAGPVFGLDIAPLPALDSYVFSSPPKDADVLAYVGEDPVIARRAAGLGRCVSIAIPIDANHNKRLGEGEGVRVLLGRAGAWAQRTVADGRFACELSRRGGKLRVAVSAADTNGPMNRLKLAARLARPGEEGAAKELPLSQVAPGGYEAAAEAGREQLVVQIVDASGQAVWLGGWGVPYAEEFGGIGPDWANLQRLAAAGGGRIVPMSGLRAAGRELVRQEYSPIWAWCLAAAALLMLVEWASVRIVRK